MNPILKNLFGPRNPDARKGDYGRVLIIGGSGVYTGAPALCALAALYSGSDIALIAAPRRAADICASISPNLITYPLAGDCLSPAHIKKILPLVEDSDAVAIGPGLGRDRRTAEAVIRLLEAIEIPCVIDADAINAFSKRKEMFKGKPSVITPHRGEFRMLAGAELSKKSAESLARQTGIVVLAKSREDIITDGKKTEINRTGNPYMTVGGTGDVLTGIAVSLLGRGASPFEAAHASAYICGRAGDITAAAFGESMTATDVIDSISQVLMEAKEE